MILSDAGLALIQRFEGYHDRLPDGSARAYLCPAKVWTIGYGCTEGVAEGMVWSKAEVDAGLHRELAKHEAAVLRFATVDLNQNEFDALVSFSYNCGIGALAGSTVLKRLNAGDRKGAASAFKLWNKGGGKVLPGLVDRRAREATLFLTPVGKSERPSMPQRVEASKEPFTARAKATAAAAVTAATTHVATNGIPPPPVKATDAVSHTDQWLSLGKGAVSSVSGVAGNPLPLLIAVGLFVVLCVWLPKRFA